MRSMNTTLVAPCGINCNLCRAHLRKNRPCPGCRIDDPNKLISRSRCKIKTCNARLHTSHRYCLSCAQCPCTELLKLDKRYRWKYGFSPVNTLQRIKKDGIRHYMAQEKVDWTCSRCGTLLCIHESECSKCGTPRRP